MKIALFGATGTAGSGVLKEALKAGHHITALVRDPNRLHVKHDNLKVVQGDVLRSDDVARAIVGADAVVSAISEGLVIANHVQPNGTAVLIREMKAAGIDRFVCFGAVGILQFNEHELVRDQAFYPAPFVAISHEHSNVLEQLQESGLQWTQVCPPMITPGEADGNYAVRADYPPPGPGQVSAGNLGHFVVSEIEARRFMGSRVGIKNA